MFLDYSHTLAVIATLQKDDFARIKRVCESHLVDLCSFSQVGSEKMSSVAGNKPASIAITTRTDAQHVSSPSSPHTSDDIESSASIDIQTIAQIPPTSAPIVNILPPVPTLNHFLSTIIGYCRIGRNEISDLLKSGKEFIDRNNDKERAYGREEQDVTMIKGGVERTITIRRSTHNAGLIIAS